MITPQIMQLISSLNPEQMPGYPQGFGPTRSSEPLFPSSFNFDPLANMGPQNPMDEVDTFDPLARMNQLYQPERQASDRLSQLINNVPQRNNPNLATKIVASIAGLTGDPNRVEEVMYGPYRRQLQDWQTQLSPAIQAANFERQGNINERTLANQIVTNEQRDRVLRRQEKRDDVLRKQGEDRINLSIRRANQADTRLEISKAVARGGQLVFQKDGAAHILYKDGKTTPVNLDMFDPAERLKLQQEYALERIEEQGENRTTNRDRVRTEVIDDPDNPGKRILVSVNMDTNEATPVKFSRTTGEKTSVTPTTRTGESEADKARKVTANALRIKASDPKYSRYINIKSGRFEGITPPSKIMAGALGGITEEDYKKLYRLIYEEDPPGIPNATNSSTSPGEGARIRVRRKNPQTGKVETGSIPASQRDQAIKAGYEVLQ